MSVAAGSYHACAVRRGGQVVCWGDSRDGRLGNGVSVESTFATPVPVQGLPAR